MSPSTGAGYGGGGVPGGVLCPGGSSKSIPLCRAPGLDPGDNISFASEAMRRRLASAGDNAPS